jgi:hypothetical protein
MVTTPLFPLIRLSEPAGVLLVRLVTDTTEELLVVALETVKAAVATTPSPTRFRLTPTRMQVYRPVAVFLHCRFFEAAVPEDPTDTVIPLKSLVE